MNAVVSYASRGFCGAALLPIASSLILSHVQITPLFFACSQHPLNQLEIRISSLKQLTT